jgi:hypothetical protein
LPGFAHVFPLKWHKIIEPKYGAGLISPGAERLLKTMETLTPGR